MKNNIENGIYIPEEQRNLIPVDEWVKREDPTTAQTVVLVTDFGMLEIAKEDLPGGFNFEGAQKAAAEYRKGFRCPTRHEAIEMYDARFRGLDEAFKKIGGEPATTIGWTSEADPDPEYNSYGAFVYNGITGFVFSYSKYRTSAVRPVFLCSLIMAAESVTNAANVTATATHEIGSASIAPPSATNDSHHGIAKILVFMSTCSKRLFSSRVAVCILPCPPCFGMLGQAGCLRVHSPPIRRTL